MEHTQHEADTLAQSDEADHSRQNHRQKADDLIENARDHIACDNRTQRGSGGGSLLNASSFPNKFMVAGA